MSAPTTSVASSTADLRLLISDVKTRLRPTNLDFPAVSVTVLLQHKGEPRVQIQLLCSGNAGGFEGIDGFNYFYVYFREWDKAKAPAVCVWPLLEMLICGTIGPLEVCCDSPMSLRDSPCWYYKHHSDY
ncbi:hypothetical protein OSB04_014632 [Centaurea solstitialis]|uniref:Uncharacterized protein n=1 Tax=Centaurea solstitialis TaxID=347529 RepID=A0AA38TFR3_9ASTR|nr:hypothetical protein OSB04_014632 [Centaurea solstitialis]